MAQLEDLYERNADAIAARVSANQSAEEILGPLTTEAGSAKLNQQPAAGTTSAPQMVKGFNIRQSAIRGNISLPTMRPPSSMPGVIQRKVGFEFETDMTIKANQKQILKKNELLYEAPSGTWKIVPDASNIEFVTIKAFEEETEDRSEIEHLITTIREMAGAFKSIITALGGTSTQAPKQEEGELDLAEQFATLSSLTEKPSSLTLPSYQSSSLHSVEEESLLGTLQEEEGESDLAQRFAALSSRGEKSSSLTLPSHQPASPRPSEKEIPSPRVSKEKESELDIFQQLAALPSYHLSEEAELDLPDIPSSTEGGVFLKDVLKTGTFYPFEGHDVYAPKQPGPFQATPQVTGGVNLENILTLFEASSKTELPLTSPSNPYEAARLNEPPTERTKLEKTPLGGSGRFEEKAEYLTLSRKWAEAYIQSVQVPDTQGWDKLQGMLALIYFYLLSGNAQTKINTQAKDTFSFMSRMSFSGMYRTLPQKVKEAYNPEFILKFTTLDPQGTVFKEGIRDKTGGDKTIYHGPTRLEWLNSIPEGKDLLSAEGGTPVTTGMGASSPAMGYYTRLDPGPKGEEEQLAQIEIRSLPKSVPPDEWESVALALFQMFQIVQQRKEK